MMKQILFTLLLLLPFLSVGQQESYYSLYRYNMNVINPAYAGAESANMLSLTSRNQWASMEDAPNTFALAFSSARENNVGLGISIVSDKVFIEQQTFVYADFSYRLQVGGEANLYLGIKGGGNFYNADPIGLNTYATNIGDPSQVSLSKFSPNVGAGAYFQSSSVWISASIPRLFNTKRDDSFVITAKDRVHSYLGGGVDFSLTDILLLKPSIMIRKVKGLPTTADLTGTVSWQNQFDFGLSIRTNSSMALMALVSLGMFDVGYAYETPTDGGLSQLNLKTHELVFRIRLGESNDTTKNGPEAPAE